MMQLADLLEEEKTKEREAVVEWLEEIVRKRDGGGDKKAVQHRGESS